MLVLLDGMLKGLEGDLAEEQDGRPLPGIPHVVALERK